MTAHAWRRASVKSNRNVDSRSSVGRAVDHAVIVPEKAKASDREIPRVSRDRLRITPRHSYKTHTRRRRAVLRKGTPLLDIKTGKYKKRSPYFLTPSSFGRA